MTQGADYTEFLKRYYWNEYSNAILDLAKEYPDRKILVVNFNDLKNYNPDAAERLIDKPDKELEQITAALKGIDIPADVDLSEATVAIKFSDDFPQTPVHRIGSDHITKLIAVKGRISKIGNVDSKPLIAAFKCQRCGDINYINQMDDRYTEPFVCQNDACGRKGPFELQFEESTFVDQQKLELQDLYENMNAGQPMRDIVVYVRGRDIINTIPAPGAQVVISGVVRLQQKTGAGGKLSLFKFVLEANHIEAIEPDINTTLTGGDKRELRELAASQDIYTKLIDSMAPNILGYPDIKLALLAAAVSGAKNHTKTLREYVHIAICGDPGTAKTVMVESLRALVPRSQYAAGKGASGAGLTVAAEKDDLGGGGYVARAGALVLADKGLIIIDELDKLESEDIQRLNTAMESGCFPFNKGGINQTFNSRCPVIAVLNPKDIRFDDSELLTRQIAIPADTLSRFDLVFKIQDTPEPGRDRAIAGHLGKRWQWAGRGDIEGAIPVETMVKYLAFAKSFEPAIPDEVTQKINDYYITELRRYEGGVIMAGARDYNAITRLTKSIAKLRLSNDCEIKDVNLAIELHKASQEAIRDPTTGKIDIDILYGGAKSQRDRINQIRSIIIDLQKGNGNQAFINDIISIAKTKGITFDQVEGDLRHLKQGDIIEVSNGFYRVVSLPDAIRKQYTTNTITKNNDNDRSTITTITNTITKENGNSINAITTNGSFQGVKCVIINEEPKNTVTEISKNTNLSTHDIGKSVISGNSGSTDNENVGNSGGNSVVKASLDTGNSGGSQRDRYRQMRDIIQELQKASKNNEAFKNDIISKAADQNIKRDQAESDLGYLTAKGEITEAGKLGFYRVT